MGKLIITPEGRAREGGARGRAAPRRVIRRPGGWRWRVRYVADRCLYGVDKNPMAVEMAKLSLWLVTLQKDRPFTFVDHALRCGDSLLGLTSAAQIERFHVDPTSATTMPLGASLVGPALKKATELRRKIEARATETLEDAEEKARMLREAEAATGDVRVIADHVIGAALATAGKGEKALDRRLEELGAAGGVEMVGEGGEGG